MCPICVNVGSWCAVCIIFSPVCLLADLYYFYRRRVYSLLPVPETAHVLKSDQRSCVFTLYSWMMPFCISLGGGSQETLMLELLPSFTVATVTS